MWDVKYAAAQFEELSTLKVERILEHRVVEWSPEEKENLLTLKVSGKEHPAFVLFDANGVKKWGFILPSARSGLKNEAGD